MMSPVMRLEYCFQKSWSRLNTSSRQRGQRLAVDLHDDAEGRQVGIHPVQGKALLDEELVLGVVVEDDLGEQAVDGHDGDLAGDLDLVVNDRDVFAGLELAELHAPLGVGHVVLETALRILGRGRCRSRGPDRPRPGSWRSPSGRRPRAAAGSGGCACGSAGFP